MSAFKFLVDENVGRSVVDYLIGKGHDVVVTKEEFPGREDLRLLDYAYQDDRIIVTNDKGFGFFIYYQNLPSKGVILFRFRKEAPAFKIAALETIITQKADKILEHFIVISESGIRIRRLAR
jgi:predicted nuclease of predicted toxin-antitoxin system